MGAADNNPGIPQIPQSIIEAIDKGKLLIFTGAGLSTLFGYPLWKQLGDDLAKECVDKGIIGRSDEEIIRSQFSPMQEVTVAFNALKEDLGKKDAIRILKKELSSEREKGHKEDIKRISTYLSNYNATIITTNADNSLDDSEAMKDRIIVKDFKKWNQKLTYESIIHLHGSIDRFNSLVFTSDQYAAAYMATSKFGENLKKLFIRDDLVVLFIGYGANELELIRYFFKAKNNNGAEFFMLSGYLDKDELKCKYDTKYYKSLGIKILPYSMEKNGYRSLFDVLESWNNDVINKTMAHLRVNKTIKKACFGLPNKESVAYIKRLLK